ncbi:MAG: hypothetical protein ABSG44_09400 [Thermodesulfobacteriota bacterium]|jgi:hypothetical protein
MLKGEPLIEFLSQSGRLRVAAIEAYLDESGTHQGANVLCVGGYVGERDEWLSFVGEWQVRLNDARISCFHARKRECDPLRPYLMNAIDKRDFRGIVVSVNPIDFKSNTTEQFKGQIGNAYATCTFLCAQEICKWAQENKWKPVSFVIEDGQPNTEYIERTLLAFMREAPDSFIAGVTRGKKAQYIPLQPADFLSHVYCDNDPFWFEQLAKSDKVFNAHLKPKEIIIASQWLKRTNTQQKNLKRRIKHGTFI